MRGLITEKTKEKTELIFFVTVKLITPGHDIEGVPLPNKTYRPEYELNQKQWNDKGEKQKIKQG